MKLKLLKLVPAGLGLAFLAALPTGTFASAFADEDEDAEEAEEAKKDEEEEDEDEFVALLGGDIHTVTGPVLRGATLLVKNGKIEEMGFDVEVPEGAETYLIEGMRVYPGLVAMSSSGLLGGTGDLNDTIDPFNSRMVLALAAGITATGQGGGVAKLKRYEVKGAVLEDARGFATFGWDTRNPSSKRSLREKLQEASRYLREFRKWEDDVKKDKKLEEPSKKGVDNTVLAVLRGELAPKFNINDRTDLLGLARLAQEFGFRPILEGAAEGWTVADELGRAGAMAVITPRYRRWKDEALVREGGSSIENAAILYRAGVPIAIIPASTGVDLSGMVGRDIMALPIEAGFAVRGGLPEQAALEAITIQPARLMGVGHRIGSLEEGKDADLIVTDGDVLHYETFVQYAFVDGSLVYDKQEELYFAHIRPRPEIELAPETKVDPGEVIEEEEEAAEEEAEEEEEEEEEEEAEDEPEEDSPEEETPEEETPKEEPEDGSGE